MGKIAELFDSIDKLFSEEKEQKFKAKLAKKIKTTIFTDDILEKINEHDFTGLADEEEDVVRLFSSIFPVIVEDKDIVFRLYKHKIEVDFSSEMKDRYIYMLSDGRYTSGMFKCLTISDEEYVTGIKIIIDVIPKLKKSLLETLSNYDKIVSSNTKLENYKEKLEISEKNYIKLMEYMEKKKE
ncbi:MAG: hypothetical protein E6248_06935 [Clostridium sp.]|uniref:hypothetical protein n=1 Tax=Clostridium sp. TaxID=1506 RepID=UPI00290CFABB|nr:hypothetical protein [Clostridium sp.]MDU5110166.1 hypothetical protein [Clostridium sp.]